jgi:hypothetical protein
MAGLWMWIELQNNLMGHRLFSLDLNPSHRRPIGPITEPTKTHGNGVVLVSLPLTNPTWRGASRENEESRERERERDEPDFNSRVRRSESSAEGEGSDPVQASSQGQAQLGRPSPHLLPRCTHSPSWSSFFTIYSISNPISLKSQFASLLTFSICDFSLFQASELRERFDANKHVVRSLQIFASICLYIVYFCTKIDMFSS